MPMKTKEEQREYQRQWVAKRRAEYFKDKVCVTCGSTEKLELDHIDPTIKVSHNIWSWSQARQEEELIKCQILCEQHHLEKTKKENSDRMGGSKHGTSNKYDHHGCRCDVCKEYKSKVNAQRYSK